MPMSQRVEAKKGSVLNASLFIAATCIGLAYFTVPILTGIAGFIPAVVMSLLVALFTLAIGLLYAEATLGQPDGANFPSISRALLGKFWMVILLAVFFLNILGYLTAYAFFTERFLSWFFNELFHLHLSPFLSGLLSTVAYFLIIFLGVRFSFTTNSILIIGLIVSFFLMIYYGSEFVLESRLLENHWIYIFFSVPSLFSAFSYLFVVPPVCSYLNRDAKKIRLSLLIATLISLVVYLIWQWFMIGSISSVTFWVDFEEGVSLDKIFAKVRQFPHISYALNFTLFFSMITSLIGNGLAFVEFMSDGVGLPLEKRKGWRRLLICFCVFAVVLPFSLYGIKPVLYFLQKFTSPVGEVLINGIIPIWMVAQARYVLSIPAPAMLPGGKISLIILGIAVFVLIYLEGIVLIRS